MVYYDFEMQQTLRPILILLCGMLLFNLPTVVYKIHLCVNGVLYFLFCWDKSFKQPSDPASVFGPLMNQSAPVIQRKTIYFVRHGESTWNDTFNKGARRSVIRFILGFIPGLIKSMLYELYLLLSGKMDSWYFDSPLSHLGLQQVQELAAFLNNRNTIDDTLGLQQHVSILRADPNAPRSKIISSNLRRAVSTLVGGFHDRLMRRPMDKILIVPSLQEISHNPDTLSITPSHTPIQASWIERNSKICNFQDLFYGQVDVSLHTGNKPINTNGLKRILEFCEFVFSGSIQEDFIIVGGHSIWFRTFFRLFLPYSVHHAAKTKKIVNGGIVVFELMKVETKKGSKFMIDPKSIKTIYGGF